MFFFSCNCSEDGDYVGMEDIKTTVNEVNSALQSVEIDLQFTLYLNIMNIMYK